MIIDFHTHIFPDKIADAAIAGLSARAGISPSFDGTKRGLTAAICDAGIDLAVSQPIATKPQQTVSINNFAIAVNREGRGVLSFGTMHPDFPDYEMELRRLAEHHVMGIKMHPVYQDFYVNDDRALPIYQCARDLGLVVLLHGGMDIGFPGVRKCTPLRCRRIVDAIRGLKLVVAHMGGYECWDEVERFLIGQDVYLDTSFASHKLGDVRMLEMIRRHGARRILFATDAPWSDQREELARMRALPLSAEEKQQIFYQNAMHLLRLEFPPGADEDSADRLIATYQERGDVHTDRQVSRTVQQEIFPACI